MGCVPHHHPSTVAAVRQAGRHGRIGWYARVMDAWDAASEDDQARADELVQAYAEGRVLRDELPQQLGAILGVQIGEWR
jgi:hypothetical protein